MHDNKGEQPLRPPLPDCACETPFPPAIMQTPPKRGSGTSGSALLSTGCITAYPQKWLRGRRPVGDLDRLVLFGLLPTRKEFLMLEAGCATQGRTVAN
jgi:hypothetical protein